MIFGVRHGERADFLSKKNPERKCIQIPFDPHLSDKGVQQAEETGRFIQKQIDKYFKLNPLATIENNNDNKEEEEESKESKPTNNDIEVIIVSSPFLRTIMTSYAIARNLRNVYKNTVFLQEDICEYLALHDYQSFPLDTLFCRSRSLELDKYIDQSRIKHAWNFFFPKSRPKFPENRYKAEDRIAAGMEQLKQAYLENFNPKKQVLVYVTHRFTLQCSALSFGNKKEPAPEDCGYCGVLQIAIEGEGKKRTEEFLLRGSNNHISHLL